jgi:hypothetical protein
MWMHVRCTTAMENRLSKVSPMSDEFHDWLDQCPVMWFRGEVTRDHVTYSFETPDEDDSEE